jgi:LacI family transcriptional regulator
LPRERVAISDVARRAGVSPTTVSHVLSGRRRVSPLLTAAVQQAVSELEYVPDHYATGLRTGAAKTIGLLVADIAQDFHAKLARGAEDAAEESGYSLIVCSSQYREQRETRYLSLLAAGSVDGLLYAAGAPPNIDKLLSVGAKLPLVVVDEELPGLSTTFVTCDNFQGGRLIGEHLRNLGHRRILYVGGPPTLLTVQQRLSGLRSAFLAGEAEIDVQFGDYGQERATEIVAQRLDASAFFTAIVAGNDLIAIGSYSALRDHGLRVPEDVSVVGFDDIPLSLYQRPPLTTVRQPVNQLGYVGAQYLLAALRAKVDPPLQRVVLPVTLVVRESTGPPRASAATQQ